jgi:glutathione S-transferase
VLEELGVPYIIQSFKFDDVKKPPFVNINPNGRVPGMYKYQLMCLIAMANLSNPPIAIVDPNTNLTLWESGAIIQYLEEEYDKDKKLTCDSMQERQLLNQWLHFQMSGQGPYYGQCGWCDGLPNSYHCETNYFDY